MSDHAAFLREICDKPDDLRPRMIYADWLDERGDVRGEFKGIIRSAKRLNCAGRTGVDAPAGPDHNPPTLARGHVMAKPHSTTRVRFKVILEFPGYYVGSDGTVWSTWRRHYAKGVFRRGVQYFSGGPWRPIKTATIRGGYQDVELRRDGRGVHCLVHRLVLIAFRGPPPTDGHECAHWNGDPADNGIENLRWATKVENHADRWRHGTRKLHRRKASA